MIEPLRISFVVACASEHAFAVWTSWPSRWWPPRHTQSGEDGLEIVFEPRAGGRIFERDAAGVERPWGEVTLWEPPRQLAESRRLGRRDPGVRRRVRGGRRGLTERSERCR